MKLKLLLALCVLVTAAHAADGYFDSNGVKIHYVTDGQGEPVVLIHGWMADATMWGKPTAPAGFQVIALDCRGHGKSDKPHDPAKYGAEMAADVVRLLDHLKIKKAHLIGYSMGVYLASKVAATHPERVLTVIYGGQAPLIAGPAWTDAEEVAVLAKAADEGKDLGRYIINVLPPDKQKPTMEQANVMADFFFKGKDAKALAAAGRSFKDLQVSADALKKCAAPTLFIYGSKDSSNTAARVEQARKLIAGSEVKVIEGADHMTTLTNPQFGATVVAFLNAHKVPFPLPDVRAGRGKGLGDGGQPNSVVPIALPERCLHLREAPLVVAWTSRSEKAQIGFEPCLEFRMEGYPIRMGGGALLRT